MPTATTPCPLVDLLQEPRPPAWQPIREAAEARLAHQAMPTTHDEDWKYFDLSGFTRLPFRPGHPATVDITPHILPETRGTRMVFVNGHFDEHHSNTSALPSGVRMLRLSQAYDAAKRLGTLATPDTSDFFGNLNTARFSDGVFIFVPQGVQVDVPLHVLFLSHQQNHAPTCAMPRLLVVLERGARLTLLEEYAGTGQTLTNAVVEVHVATNAHLSHDRLQRESPEAWHFSALAAKVHDGGHYTCRTSTFGALASRHHPRILLAESTASLELQGLALLQAHQVADTHSIVEHLVPSCVSHQLHKTIAGGHGRGIFNGKVFVRPGAQQTDAQQQSRNLLLSPDARVDTKPELEIFADDVKCTHGATVGALDPEELFYLQSRGLKETDARNLLTYGFASEIISAMPLPTLRRDLRSLILAWTHAAP